MQEKTAMRYLATAVALLLFVTGALAQIPSSTFRSICVIFSAFTRGPFGKRTDTKSC